MKLPSDCWQTQRWSHTNFLTSNAMIPLLEHCVIMEIKSYFQQNLVSLLSTNFNFFSFRLVVMMLSLIGSLIFIAIWIYIGVHFVSNIGESIGHILSPIFYVPACVVLPIDGKFKFFFYFDYAKDIKEYWTSSFVFPFEACLST